MKRFKSEKTVRMRFGTKLYRTEDGVTIHIRYGRHKLHKFPSEANRSEEQIRRLTPQYGWTILCNDRAVIMSDKTHKTGWDITKFHSDFYGFVGYVNFVCEDPLKLPWKTTKTDIDLNNPAYQMALRDMRHFAEEWRSHTSERKKTKEAAKPVPPKKATSTAAGKKTPKGKKGPAPSGPITKTDHNNFRTVLPSDINEVHCFDKHLALVRQSKGFLDMVEFSYPGLALLRMLFETSTVKYMHRKGKLGELRKFALDRRKAKVNMSPEQEKHATISMDEMIAYFASGPGVFDAATQAYMRHVVGKVGKHQQTLNSATFPLIPCR